MNYLPKNILERYKIYEMKGRNLRYGVWTGEKFVGLRHKFGHLFLEEERYWDDEGTAKPLQALGYVGQVALDIGEFVCSLNEPVVWENARHTYHHVKDGTKCTHEIRFVRNEELFCWLQGFEAGVEAATNVSVSA